MDDTETQANRGDELRAAAAAGAAFICRRHRRAVVVGKAEARDPASARNVGATASGESIHPETL